MDHLRASAALALLLLLAACADPVPFEIVIENVDTETRYLRSSRGRPMIVLEEQVGDEWTGVWASREAMCSRRCGVAAGSVACLMGAAEISRAWALLAGEQTSVLRDSQAWVFDRDALGDCARKTPLAGPLRIEMCHSREVEDSAGPLDVDPDSSGAVGEEWDESWPADPVCEYLEFTLDPEDPVVLIELEE